MKTGALTLAALIVLLPWIVRNYSLSGTPTFSESVIGGAAFQGLHVTKTMGEGKTYQQRVHEGRWLQSDVAASKGADFVRFEDDIFWDIFPTIEDEQLYNKVLLQQTIDEYSADPMLFLRHCLYNSIRFWFQGATPKITILGFIVMVPFLVLAVLGIYEAIRFRMPIAPLLLITVTIYMVHIPLISHARYSTPLIPFLAVLAGIAINAASQRRWLIFKPTTQPTN